MSIPPIPDLDDLEDDESAKEKLMNSIKEIVKDRIQIQCFDCYRVGEASVDISRTLKERIAEGFEILKFQGWGYGDKGWVCEDCCIKALMIFTLKMKHRYANDGLPLILKDKPVG